MTSFVIFGGCVSVPAVRFQSRVFGVLFFEAKLPPKLYQLVGPLIHGEAQIKTSSNLWFLVGILLCTK